jgi:hypothetical protein
LEVPPHYRASKPEKAKNIEAKKKKLSKSEEALLKEME